MGLGVGNGLGAQRLDEGFAASSSPPELPSGDGCAVLGGFNLFRNLLLLLCPVELVESNVVSKVSAQQVFFSKYRLYLWDESK